MANEGLIARSILSYLISHPMAEDTVEGISEWWLLEEQIKIRVKEVHEALDELTSQKLIIAHKSRDSRIRYRINKRKLNQIRALLEGQTGDS
jgi:Fe2+ or Zn2+ uptake regulation protein